MLLGVIADDFTGASDIASFISRLACEITAGRRFKSVQGDTVNQTRFSTAVTPPCRR